MATTKATSKSASKTARKTTAKKAAPAKAETTVRTVSAKEVASKEVTNKKKTSKLPGNIVNIVLAELIGTFVLSAVAVMTATDVTPLYIGLTLMALVMTIGLVSGAHVNPAVTFGLWSARKLKGILVPFYMASQFLGAMAAVVVISLVSGKQLGLDFGHFLNFSMPVFWAELVGTALFLFVLTSVLARTDLSANGKAVGVGFSLFVGLIVAGSLFAPAVTKADADYLKSLQDIAGQSTSGSVDYAQLRDVTVPEASLVGNPVLNPAVALAATESKTAQDIYTNYGINDAATSDKPATYSRLTLEVVLATLIGAALGANLTRLIGYRFKN